MQHLYTPATPASLTMAGNFKDLGTGVALLAVGFCLGAIYSNWTFDYWLLWVSPTPEEWLERALEHYKLKAEQSISLHHVLHGVILLGFTGLTAKLYKPTEANTLFDGGSLALFFIAVVFYITNMRPACYSLTTGNWGDIDAETGIRLIAAAQVLIVLVLFGVIAMQAGQWWAIPQVKVENAKISQEKAAEAAEESASDAEVKPKATSSGASSGTPNKASKKRK